MNCPNCKSVIELDRSKLDAGTVAELQPPELCRYHALMDKCVEALKTVQKELCASQCIASVLVVNMHVKECIDAQMLLAEIKRAKEQA